MYQTTLMNALKVPHEAYVLNARRKMTTHLGFCKCNKNFVIAFPKKEHAVLANKSITKSTQFDLIHRFDLTEKSHVVDFKIIKDPNQKTSTTTNVYDVQETDMIDILAMPAVEKIGIVVPIDILLEESTGIVFTSVLIEPSDA